METVTFRTRSIAWFITGALLATAVTLMFANAWRADAAPGDTDATFVPITPCRLADTRPAPDRVGPAGTLSAADTTTFAVHGTNGECTIPTDAVAVSLNVTALGASTLSFLTFWPDGERPLAASLNPAPGEPPTPNAVTVDLSGAGGFNVYNDTGTVNVVIDVNGYYIQASLQELASRLAAVEAAQAAGVDPAVLARLDAVESSTAANAADVAANETAISTLDAAQPFTVNNEIPTTGSALSAWTDIIEVPVTAPVDGNVTVMAQLTADEGSDGLEVYCGVNDANANPGVSQFWVPGTDVSDGSFTSNYHAMTPVRTFPITAGANVTYYLMCVNASGGTTEINVPTITAIFTPLP